MNVDVHTSLIRNYGETKTVILAERSIGDKESIKFCSMNLCYIVFIHF